MRRSPLVGKLESLLRLIMIHGFSGVLPLYIVVEYPRSGGSWFSQMLSDCLHVPFPRNEVPRLTACIMHGHYLYSPHFRNVFCVFRDGRDVMVSFYYHSLFENERYNSELVAYTRRQLASKDFDDIRRNLPGFIEYTFTHRRHPRFTWSEFVDSWIDKDVATVKYEDLLEDAPGELYRSILEVSGKRSDASRLGEIVERYSFENLAKREPGQEDKRSFLRKGIAGDWRNLFDREAREVFNYYAGETLIRLGYEQDSSWVNEEECGSSR